MKHQLVVCLLVLGYMLCPETRPWAQPVPGVPGSTSQWGSGWIDLSVTTNFKRGDRLRLKLGGTANKVIVRLLPNGASPDSPSGIEGGPLNVPPNRILDITLTQDHRNVVQISVHGGPSPWGRYSLGAGNGPVEVLSVERLDR